MAPSTSTARTRRRVPDHRRRVVQYGATNDRTTVRIRDLVAVAGAAAALVGLLTWWVREGLDAPPTPAPVDLGPADPARHFGAEAAAAAALADQVVVETHGDLVAAERRFDRRRGGEER